MFMSKKKVDDLKDGDGMLDDGDPADLDQAEPREGADAYSGEKLGDVDDRAAARIANQSA